MVELVLNKNKYKLFKKFEIILRRIKKNITIIIIFKKNTFLEGKISSITYFVKNGTGKFASEKIKPHIPANIPYFQKDLHKNKTSL